MQTHEKLTVAATNLQLAHTTLEKAQRACEANGIALNDFVNLAVAEVADRYAEAEWLRRPKATAAEIDRARRLLRRPDSRSPDPGDELPEGYVLPELP